MVNRVKSLTNTLIRLRTFDDPTVVHADCTQGKPVRRLEDWSRPLFGHHIRHGVRSRWPCYRCILTSFAQRPILQNPFFQKERKPSKPSNRPNLNYDEHFKIVASRTVTSKAVQVRSGSDSKDSAEPRFRPKASVAERAPSGLMRFCAFSPRVLPKIWFFEPNCAWLLS